jgi:hypothetical protein
VHTPRRRAKARTGVLYWFRTPPGVRVGRAPLDEDAIRLIEEHHPDIRFDWPQILKGEEEKEPVYRPPMPAPVVPDPVPTEPVNPAHAQLGSEGLARLRARYADVMAGISRRVPDPDRREQLKIEAERLNPDTWVTSEEVRVALEQYETVFESLRGLVPTGRRRRRRRSGVRPSGPAPAGQAEAGLSPSADTAAQDSPEDGPDDDNGPE